MILGIALARHRYAVASHSIIRATTTIHSHRSKQMVRKTLLPQIITYANATICFHSCNCNACLSNSPSASYNNPIRKRTHLLRSMVLHF